VAAENSTQAAVDGQPAVPLAAGHIAMQRSLLAPEQLVAT
jgi:hypothetical protein